MYKYDLKKYLKYLFIYSVSFTVFLNNINASFVSIRENHNNKNLTDPRLWQCVFICISFQVNMSRFGANVNSVPPVTGRHFHLQTSSLYIEVSVTSCHWTNCISICTTSRHNMDSQHDQSVRHFGTFSSKNPAHAVQISHFVIICSKLLICECCALKTAQ